jgi:GH25 family lysozyme M1 (1,4-beta-N-acetylmuramidase)
MTVKGCDYSHYQNTPDVAALASGGVEFVIIKAWEGSSPDPDFTVNLDNALAVDMPALSLTSLATCIQAQSKCREASAETGLPFAGASDSSLDDRQLFCRVSPLSTCGI